ncbi:unnamed protein product [Vitrella brassicaformis CCMP3155]|uniref:RING-CH-type domain-containing protein n=1 Tax=Vitrella brassicaformis (strain CCMP3155) TaxID=1169540 RepID=A0A0G4GKI3_VITBC|nr:unnamed protein product [Vitrella brassicaformis CCMP3155]|eukprot:CEM30529.1 unnamed protein product [Vitrella brassicaformis CCMP3155]
MGLLAECLSPWLVWPPEPDASCRICLDTNEDIDNGPLISPCDCRGTGKWVHASCLWEASRRSGWRMVNCYICKAPYRFDDGISNAQLLGSFFPAPTTAEGGAPIALDKTKSLDIPQDVLLARRAQPPPAEAGFQEEQDDSEQREEFAGFLFFVAVGILGMMALRFVLHLLLSVFHPLYHSSCRSPHPTACVTAAYILLPGLVSMAPRFAAAGVPDALSRRWLQISSSCEGKCGPCDIAVMILLISIAWFLRLAMDSTALRLTWNQLQKALRRVWRRNTTRTVSLWAALLENLLNILLGVADGASFLWSLLERSFAAFVLVCFPVRAGMRAVLCFGCVGPVRGGVLVAGVLCLFCLILFAERRIRVSLRRGR